MKVSKELDQAFQDGAEYRRGFRIGLIVGMVLGALGIITSLYSVLGHLPK